MQEPPTIILASRSPRRAELLDQVGLRYRRTIVDVDETRRTGEEPAEFARRLALAKARAGWCARADAPVLGADTAVVLDDEIFGKPRDRGQALSMLARLSGRAHRVYSGVAVVAGAGESAAVSVSTVHFRRIDKTEAEAYWETGEPVDKAGAYAIQGRGAVFVERLEGSYSGVMGLPLYETAGLLRRFGIDAL